MEAIVLAGGFGTRLKEVVPDLPKPMAPVSGHPFLEILLTSLADKGFTRVILSLGFMAEKIVSYFGDRFSGIELIYVIEESPLGTGGAVYKALTNCITDHVFILNGDTFVDLQVNDIENKWQENQAPIIVACDVPDTSRYGKLETKNDRVIGFSEKDIPGRGLINAGCYVFPTNLLNDFTAGENFSLETDYLIHAVLTQRFDYFVNNGIFIDIGVPEDYERAQTLSQLHI